MGKRTVNVPARDKWVDSNRNGRLRVIRFAEGLSANAEIRPGRPLLYVVPEDAEEVDPSVDGWAINSPWCGIVEEVLVRIDAIVDAKAPLVSVVTGVLMTDPKTLQRRVVPTDGSRIETIKTQLTEVDRAEDCLPLLRVAATKLNRNDCDSAELSREESSAIKEWASLTTWFVDIYSDPICKIATTFAIDRLKKYGITKLNPQDLAQEATFRILSEWESGTLLNAFLVDREKRSDSRLRSFLIRRVAWRVMDALRAELRSMEGQQIHVDADEEEAPDGNRQKRREPDPDKKDTAVRLQQLPPEILIEKDPDVIQLINTMMESLPADHKIIFQAWCDTCRQGLGDNQRREFNYWIGPLPEGQTAEEWFAAFPEDLRVSSREPGQGTIIANASLRRRKSRSMKRLIDLAKDNLRSSHPDNIDSDLTRREIFERIAATFLANKVPIDNALVLMLFNECWGAEGDSA